MKLALILLVSLYCFSPVYGQEVFVYGEKDRLVREWWWSSCHQPYGEDTNRIVELAFVRAARQFELNSQIDIRFMGYTCDTLQSAGNTDYCFGVFFTQEEYVEWTGREFTGGAFGLEGRFANFRSLGMHSDPFCLIGVLEEIFLPHQLGKTILHELGHTVDLRHPSNTSIWPGSGLLIAGGEEFSRDTGVMSSPSNFDFPFFTAYDRVILALAGWGVDTENPNFIPAEAFIRIPQESWDRDAYSIYVPVIEIGGPGGDEAWARLIYEGLVDGQHEWRFDVVRRWPNPLNLPFLELIETPPTIFSYGAGFLSDIIPEIDTYEWRNPSRFYDDGVLEILILYDDEGGYWDVILRVPNMKDPVEEWKFILESIGGRFGL